MSQWYFCKDQRCQNDIDGLGAVIEHLRKKHVSYIRLPPGGLGAPDRHRHVWYCFRCEDHKTGKDHKSFNSDEAMWAHLKSHYDSELDYITLEQ